MQEIRIFKTLGGRQPFIEWQDKLDGKTRAIIRTRLDRVILGNFGDCKLMKNGDGLSELRIAYGPGYRVYFGRHNALIVVLLTGGDKSSQRRDINQAKLYWQEYKERTSR